MSRQNGKNGAIEVVELGWMMTEPGVSILHTAHEFQTALESMDKLEALIRSSPLTEAEIAPRGIKRGNGKESIRFKNGSIIRFRTRTKSGGRGFSVDRLVIDEAMIWSPASQAAIMPLLTTAENPQIWYLGSAADADTHEYCQKWAALRARAIGAGDQRLCWLEWSAPDPPKEFALRDAWRTDPQNWACANPSMGFLLDEEFIESEMASFAGNLEKWEIERLSTGRWPEVGRRVEPIIDMDLWGSMAQSAPNVKGQIALGVDMTADQKWVTIGAATWTSDELVRLEVGYHEAPSSAVIDKILDLIAKWDPCCLVINASSPAKSLLPQLVAKGIEPEMTTSTQMAEACGLFYTSAVNREFSHADDPRLTDALQGAEKRVVGGGAWGWDYQSQVVISPLQAVTLAHWGLITFGSTMTPPQTPTQDDDVASDHHEIDLMTAGF
ncbi:hypothetical protein [Williamsia sp.]|uniref:hypothetical protein n=1 Tax=Williamsia sp. TaxID=1872085 RepID=UPI002F95B711